jgi:hypothetical protein
MAEPFNANRSWDEAVRLLKANRELILILAGLFFLLPNLVAAAFQPSALAGPEIADAANAEPVIRSWLQENGMVSLLLQIVQTIGLLSILALLARRRPTVGESIRTGVYAFLPAIAANLILAVGIILAAGVLLGLFSLAGPAGALLAIVLLIPVFVWLIARFAPLLPLFVFENIRNPLRAIARSWQLTKGRGWRIAAFLALLLVAAIIISIIASMLFALVTALVGNAELAQFVGLSLGVLIGAVLQAVAACVLAAIYRQLTMREAPTALNPRG